VGSGGGESREGLFKAFLFFPSDVGPNKVMGRADFILFSQ
jgi:hypothetical protein